MGCQPSKARQVDQVRLDQTLLTEMEYLNLLPDTSQQDVNEASFLKSLANHSQFVDDSHRVKELQEQVELYRQQIEEMEVKSAKASEQSSSSQVDLEKAKSEAEGEIRDLKAQLAQARQSKLTEVAALKQQHSVELQTLHRIVDQNVDKKTHFEILAALQASEAKQRSLVSEIVSLRKQLNDKESQNEKLETKLQQTEKQIALQKITQQRQAKQAVIPVSSNGLLQF